MERHPENNQISSEELRRKGSRLCLVEKGIKVSDWCRHFAEDVSYLAQPLARLGVATTPNPSRGPLGVQVHPSRTGTSTNTERFATHTISVCGK